MDGSEYPEIMTTEQAAKFLQVQELTIRRKIESGELRASKVGRIWRIQKKDIIDYLNKNANVPEDAKEGK